MSISHEVMKSHIRNDDSGLNGTGAKGVFAPSRKAFTLWKYFSIDMQHESSMLIHALCTARN